MNSNVTNAFRYLVGATFLIFGFNGLTGLLASTGITSIVVQPDQAMTGAMFSTPFTMSAFQALQAATGIALIMGRFVPLALIIAAPIVVNSLSISLFSESASLPTSIVLAAGLVVLTKSYWSHFSGILNKDAQASN